MKTIWQSIKENVLFLVNYRREMRRLREEERTLDQDVLLHELVIWPAMIREMKAERKRG